MIHLDQIHSPAFQKICDYIWSDDVGRVEKSGVYGYFDSISKELNKPLISEASMPLSGVIFVGMCHILEDVFRRLPRDGNYIIVHRTNDRPFTQEMYDKKPPSVKHIYTVDSRVYASDVSAIPFGNASINGTDNLIDIIYKEKIPKAKTLIFARYNVNPDTPHRNESLKYLRNNPIVKLVEEQIPADEFYRNVKAHKYTMALAGCGADASRQWAAIQLGSIPIVTDCLEMWHFNDMPMIYCPADFTKLNEEWLNGHDLSNKSTERMTMTYWTKHLQDKRNEYGIN